MKKQTKWWFALIIALLLSILFSLMGLYLISYIIPYSRSTKDIENATKSQYRALEGIERAVYAISENSLGYSSGNTLNPNKREIIRYTIVGSGSTIPRPWAGNGLDADWNKISQAEPIQILIWNNRLENNWITLKARIPSFWWEENIWTSSSWATKLFSWQISSSKDSTSPIYASGWILTVNDLTSLSWNWIDLSLREWEVFTQTSSEKKIFSNYYNQNCWVNKECVLRIAQINALINNNNNTQEIPYLEYQISANASLPYQVSDIDTFGYSYGFSRRYRARVPQATTSAAFDFTVFQ